MKMIFPDPPDARYEPRYRPPLLLPDPPRAPPKCAYCGAAGAKCSNCGVATHEKCQNCGAPR